MATEPHRDDETYIVENAFAPAFEAAKAIYPYTREDFARRAVHKMCERLWNNAKKPSYEKQTFQEMKSLAVTAIGVVGDDRSGYHSFLTRYKNLGGFKRIRTKKPSVDKASKRTNTPPTDANWGLIRHLCAREQLERAVEAGEDRLSPDWAPEYTGPIGDDYFAR